MVDLSIERPNGQFISKYSLVVEVRPIKGKIDHPTFFLKYVTSAIQTLCYGSDPGSTIIHEHFM